MGCVSKGFRMRFACVSISAVFRWCFERFRSDWLGAVLITVRFDINLPPSRPDPSSLNPVQTEQSLQVNRQPTYSTTVLQNGKRNVLEALLNILAAGPQKRYAFIGK